MRKNFAQPAVWHATSWIAGLLEEADEERASYT